MNTLRILKFIISQGKPVSIRQLTDEMKLSERSIRNLINELKNAGEKNGFQIELLRNKGYVIRVTCQEQFDAYVRQPYVNLYDQEQRIHIITAYLLQMDGYISIDSIAETMALSRNTIISCLDKIQEKLDDYDLKLDRKKHYGIRIIGNEENYRQAFSVFVLKENFLLPTHKFMEFEKTFKSEELQKALDHILREENILVVPAALESLVDHIRILIFRSLSCNFISGKQEVPIEINRSFQNAAEKIAAWINENYNVKLPESEIYFFAVQFWAKTSLEESDFQEREKFYAKLIKILQELDREFQTDFSEDPTLINGLMLHVMPLMKRMYYKIQLKNPIIEEIYSNYANIFVIALRFSDLIKKEHDYTLPKDEIGYLAVHFAAHLERQKQSFFKQIKRIVLITQLSVGNANLLRLQLEAVFPEALIINSLGGNLEQFNEQLPDLFLSTLETEPDYKDVPIIKIREILGEKEIEKMKQTIFVRINERDSKKPPSSLNELFQEELFYHCEGRSYMEALADCAADLEKKGYAAEGFASSVLEREQKCTTIYKNGVAGPHPMKPNAIRESISILIFDTPSVWENREVELVFLINLKAGHLFLHREISRLMIKIMDNPSLKKNLIHSRSFREFIMELNTLL